MKHSVYTPFTKDPCDIGQIMRGLIAVCRLWKGDTWTRKIAICDGGNEERSCLLGLQPDASVLLCVLYSPSHWVLLVATRPVQGSSPAHPARACVLYDGKEDKVCRDAAEAFRCHLLAVRWMQDPGPLVVASTRRQDDAWSCGHRVVVAADLVLARLFEDGCLPAVLHGPTEQEIRVLLDTAAKCARMKREREQEAASRPAAAAAAGILQDDDEEYEEHDDAEDDEEHEEDVEDARDIGHAEESMESEPNEARTPKRSKTTARSFLDTPDSKFSDEAMTPPAVSRKVTTLDRAPRKGQAEKAAKPAQNAERSKKERQAAGLARCNERGVGHTCFRKSTMQPAVHQPRDTGSAFSKLQGIGRRCLCARSAKRCWKHLTVMLLGVRRLQPPASSHLLLQPPWVPGYTPEDVHAKVRRLSHDGRCPCSSSSIAKTFMSRPASRLPKQPNTGARLVGGR